MINKRIGWLINVQTNNAIRKLKQKYRTLIEILRSPVNCSSQYKNDQIRMGIFRSFFKK